MTSARIFALLCLFLSRWAFAIGEGPQTLTLSGQLFTTPSGTTVLTDPSVAFKIQILDPSKSCILYEETQTISTETTSGYFTIYVGSPTTGSSSLKRTSSDSGNTMATIYQNVSSMTGKLLSNGSACTYTPANGDDRYFRLYVTPSSTSVVNTLSPDMILDSVPMATVAESLQGISSSNILQADSTTSLNQSNLATVFSNTNYPKLGSLLSGSSTQYVPASSSAGAELPSYTSATPPTGLAAGSIWYDSTDGVVKYYNGSTSQTLGTSGAGLSSLTVGSNLTASGTVGGTLTSPGTIDLATTGVSANTYTKVTVDTYGRVTAGAQITGSDITSGTIGGSTAFSSSGNITTTGTVTGATVSATNLTGRNIQIFDSGSNKITLQTVNSLPSSYTLTLPSSVASQAGQMLTSDTSGNLSWTTPSTGSVTSVSVTSPITNSGSASAPNINIQQANTSQSGYLSSADWNTFNGKLTSTLASGDVFVGNSSNVATAVAPTGDISVTNAGAFTVKQIQGTAVSNTTPTAAGQVLRYNGSTQYAPSYLGIADIRSTVSGNAQFFPENCTSSQTMTYSAVTDTYSCTNITSSGGSALSSLTAATATNTIDNTTYAQTWNWSTATTQSPLTINANSLTTGSALKIASSSSSLNSTSGLLNVANTSTSTNGTLATFQSNSTAGSGMTILTSGNVGIGTTSPAQKLDVGGNINVSGSYNIGGNTMLATPGYVNNIAVGTNALINNANGSGNTAVGDSALGYSTANANIAFGFLAGGKITSGSSNIAIGYEVGNTTLTTGSNNILIGTSSAVDTPIANTSNFLNIGNAIFATGMTGTLSSPAGNVGIGTTNPGSALDVNGTLRLDGSTSGYSALKSPATAGSVTWTLPSADGTNGQVLSTNGAGTLSWASGNSGSVTSVSSGTGLTGGPITTTGTLSLASIANNTILANTSGSSAAPTATAISPILDSISSTQGSVLYRGSSTWSALAPGTSGQVLQSGGSAANPSWVTPAVTSGVSVTAPITNSGTAAAPNIGITLASGDIFVGNASNVPTAVAASGDVSMTNTGAFTVKQIQGTAVSSTAPTAAGQVLRYNGSTQYAPSYIGIADIRSTVSGNAQFFPENCTSSQTMTYSAVTDTYSCTTITSSSGTPISGLTAATATNTIDNTNYAQTWNWSTATTQSPLTINANSLTTGTALKIASSSSSLNSTSGLLDVANTSTSTNGTLATFQSNSTSGSGMTILTSGNVGIGTTSPANILQVIGSGNYGVAEIVGNGTNVESSIGLRSSNVSKGATGDWILGVNITGETTNNFSIWSGGGTNNAVTVTPAGNVGIGTTNPLFPLDVTGSMRATNGIYFNNSASGYGAFVVNTANESLRFGTNNAENMRINSAGNVGIGTTNPTRPLDIAAATTHSASGAASQLSLRGTANSTNKLNVGYDTTNNYGYIEAVNESTAWQNLLLQPGGGNVGIGNFSPGQTLTVTGDISMSTTTTTDGLTVSGTQTAGYTTSTSLYANMASFALNNIVQTGDMGLIYKGTAVNNANGFVIAPWASGTSGIRMNSSGNVGIGTASPGATLEIDGASGTTLKIVDGNQGSGKVLTSDANGVASWQTSSGGSSGRTSCPSGFTMMGTSGTLEAYCISSSEETSASWTSAISGCYSKSPSAHLCSPVEWAIACTAGASGPNNMTSAWEWVGDVASSSQGMLMGNSACDQTTSTNLTNSFPYRCCFH